MLGRATFSLIFSGVFSVGASAIRTGEAGGLFAGFCGDSLIGSATDSFTGKGASLILTCCESSSDFALSGVKERDYKYG